MSLRAKVTILIVAVFIIYGAFDYGVQYFFVLPSFQVLERAEALEDMDRVLQVIECEANYMLATAGDWAFWDDTYQFVVDRNDAYREANLNIKTLQNLRVHLMYIFDATRQLAWGMVYDQDTEEEITLPELAGDYLPADHPLVALPKTDSQVKGIITTVHGPLLVVAQPILNNHREGPVRGSLVLGQFLNPAAIAEQARVQFTVSTIEEGKAPAPEETAVVGDLGNKGESIFRAGEEADRVYRILPDLFGRPALLLQVDVPKVISARGQRAIDYALLSLLVAGIFTLVVLLIGLRHLVLDPIQRLTAHAITVGQQGNLTAHLSLARGDELEVLAREFDRMVERLAEARKKLIEQSFQAGIAELASGVLHNIGNAITPLKVRIASLSDTVRHLPAADLEMALVELVDGTPPPERRRDLEQFAMLAGREVASALDKTIEQLAGVARQVDHVQKILDDQERFSRATRVLEPVQVDELVRQSSELLGDELRRDLRLELDASLSAVGAMLGSRVALQQVLINLLKNAAEAIRRHSSSPDRGRILVDATTELSDGSSVIHLRVIDNGIGISPEQLPHIFERGFSTKSRPCSGIGLHWCAITMTAMNGKLYADSAGTGQGACLHLLLPQAELPQMPLAAAAGG